MALIINLGPISVWYKLKNKSGKENKNRPVWVDPRVKRLEVEIYSSIYN